MILRRVAAHFRRHDWTAVLIDLVIVVLGVFIGLQAQDWATTHAEQRRADVLLQQLRGDLDSDRHSIQAYLDYQKVTAAYARSALQALASPKTAAPDTLVASAYQASQIYTTASSRATYDEMKSTGAFNLIRDARLRALLIGYYSFDWSQSATMKAEAPYRERIRSVMPYELQNAIKQSCGDINAISGSLVITRLPKTCHLDLPAAEIAHAADILYATPNLLPALTYQLSVTETNIATMQPVQQQLADLILAAGKVTQ